MWCRYLKSTVHFSQHYNSIPCRYLSELSFEQMPTPKGLPIIGTTLSLLAAGSTPKLHKYVDNRHKQLGPIYREKLGPVDCIFISDPNEIRSVFAQEGKYPRHILPEAWITYNQIYDCKRGLFFMDGEQWKYHRTIMNKLLLKGDLSWIEHACDFVSELTIRQFNHLTTPDLEKIFYKWSLETIIAILLGVKQYENLYSDLHKDIVKLAETVQSVFETSAKLALIPSSIAAKFQIPRWKNFVSSVDEALAGANQLVHRLTNDYYKPESDGLLPKLLRENIEDKEIKSIVADLILAAGDTTAYAMEWMLYLIAKNTNVQQKLRETSDQTLLQNILRETLRLYPVAPFLTRILSEDTIISGYSVPKNTIIVMSIYSTGRDSKYFENPEIFDPWRWERTDDSKKIMLKASMPFAIGARSCIGRKIAEIQLQTTLLKCVNRFQIELLNKNDIEIVLKMVAIPSQPIRLKFKPISK